MYLTGRGEYRRRASGWLELQRTVLTQVTPKTDISQFETDISQFETDISQFETQRFRLMIPLQNWLLSPEIQ